MNKHIKELAEQAGMFIVDDQFSSGGRFAEKFAKLIIHECAKIADIADENKCEWIGGNILTYFGVKE